MTHRWDYESRGDFFCTRCEEDKEDVKNLVQAEVFTYICPDCGNQEDVPR